MTASTAAPHSLTAHLAEVAATLTGPAQADAYIPARRVAKHLGISDSQVYALVKEGELEAIRIGNRIQIPASSVAALITRSRIEPTAAANG